VDSVAVGLAGGSFRCRELGELEPWVIGKHPNERLSDGARGAEHSDAMSPSPRCM
jgi:hypothetical protein